MSSSLFYWHDLGLGSWSNQIAPWQWYIHGSAATSQYLGVSSSFKNPADTTDAQGLRTTIVRVFCVVHFACYLTAFFLGRNCLLEWANYGADRGYSPNHRQLGNWSPLLPFLAQDIFNQRTQSGFRAPDRLVGHVSSILYEHMWLIPVSKALRVTSQNSNSV